MPTITRLKDLKTSKHDKYKHNNQSAKFYNSKSWKTLRNSYIRSYPLCERCLENNIITPAEHVHHKREFLSGNTDEERWQLLLDTDNLMSVCIKCHKEIHKHITN